MRRSLLQELHIGIASLAFIVTLLYLTHDHCVNWRLLHLLIKHCCLFVRKRCLNVFIGDLYPSRVYNASVSAVVSACKMRLNQILSFKRIRYPAAFHVLGKPEEELGRIILITPMGIASPDGPYIL